MASSSELTIAEPSDPNKPIGLDNFGNICYLNALIHPSRQQQQQQQPLPPLPKNDNPKRFLLLLKSLFQKLSQKGGDVVSVGVDRDLAVTVLSGSSSGSPPKTSQKMVGVEDPMDVDKDQVDEKVLLNAQQDVGEFMDVFVDMAEKGFRSFGDQKNADMIKRLFFGKTTQTLKYLESTGTPTQSGTQDEFMYLTIDVAHDIYASLDSYFRAIAVDYENRKALRSVKLKSLPPILTLQLQRVQYDVSQGCAVKSNKFMKFYDEIDMAA
ncbi:hypothetical protein BDR26DRAFT_850736 [Obelidium mucronatum]|nr:hypothetical protein BDR26DRAFT_850736 [Obelidium mucronatum]